MPGATPYRKNDKAKPKKRKPTWKPGTKVPAPTFPKVVAFGSITANEGTGKTIYARPVNPGLADMEYRSPHFDGPKYEPAKDHARLTGQLRRVFDMLQGGEWWTVQELEEYLAPSGPIAQTGIASRLRDLRKEKFGAYNVESRRRGSGGLWEYRLVL